MIHHDLTDDDRDRASLYALDALSTEDARAFERHLSEGCPACRHEVDALRALAADVGIAAPPVRPPSVLRQRVLDLAGREPAGAMAVIRAKERVWTEIAPGISRQDLTVTPGGNVFLIRIAPGAKIPAHHHTVPEHCYVIEGDAFLAGEHLGQGDHHIAGAGSLHDGISSESGCLLLIADVPA